MYQIRSQNAYRNGGHTMETTLTAAFKKKADLDLAAIDLRKQGVLDLRIYNLVDHIDTSEEISYSLDVFVEKSRCRQAEDTIMRHGGKL
jgi:hypothetical protein